MGGMRPHLTHTVLSLTVCVTGAGAGVDNAWEQEKLEVRKMLGNATESPASSARFVSRAYDWKTHGNLRRFVGFQYYLYFLSSSLELQV